MSGPVYFQLPHADISELSKGIPAQTRRLAAHELLHCMTGFLTVEKNSGRENLPASFNRHAQATTGNWDWDHAIVPPRIALHGLPQVLILVGWSIRHVTEAQTTGVLMVSRDTRMVAHQMLYDITSPWLSVCV
jgi:hypothetical protein